jgi:hypothetical protein
MEAFSESIPKRQTNATTEYLARYVLGTSVTPALRELELHGTADAWLILFGRTKRSLRVVQLTGVLCLLAASPSGGDRQNPRKSPTQRRPLPTE